MHRFVIPWLSKDKFVGIAHRGASHHFPENTLMAFAAAVQMGADAIELDVHLTQDGQVVVIHDERVERTTNGNGRVAEMTWAELSRLDAGTWKGSGFWGLRIPRLQDVLKWLPADIGLNIELKGEPDTVIPLADAVLAEISGHPRSKQILFSSFHHPVLLYLHQQNPQIALGALVSTPEWFSPLLDELPLVTIHPHHRTVHDVQMNAARRRNLKVLAWIVQTLDQCDRCLQQGVDGVILNDPLLLSPAVPLVHE